MYCRGALIACVVLSTFLAIEDCSLSSQLTDAIDLKPRWQVGDHWVVETETLQMQAADANQARSRGGPVRWQFAVAKIENLDGRQCYRVEIRSTLPGRRQPVTVLWIDRQSLAVRQFQTDLPVQGGFRRVLESYQFSQQQASPVLTPLTVLPLDMPLFQADQSKVVKDFTYEAWSGPAGVKAAGDIGFTAKVRQTVSRPDQQHIKGLLDDEFSKDLLSQPAIEVRLDSPQRQVRQLWQAGRPWPVFAENGVSRARLVKVMAAGEGGKRGADKSSEETQDEGNDRAGGVKGIEKARSAVVPWSGYWWPMREGRIFGPLGKYDKITGHRASRWERENHPPKPDLPGWFGYCHAWAASAVMEKEPVQVQTAQPRNGQPVPLGVGDQKGLLALCHTQDAANSYGDRFGDEVGSEDKQDLAPDALWHVLSLYVKQNNVPLILDIESGDEVWNYPVYEYQVKYAERGGSGKQTAELTLLMADNGVPPDYHGVKIRRHTYRFTFELRDGAVVEGSGRWIGRSREDHPDFAWYPFLAIAENPEMKYAEVQQLVAGGPLPPEPNPPVEPPSEPQPKPAPKPPPKPAPKPPSEPPPEPVTLPVGPGRPEPLAISPMELVALILDKTSSFGLEMTVDRFDGATYYVGERFFVRCAPERAGYLYLIQIDSKGVPTLLYPTCGEDNRIGADKSAAIPSENPQAGFPVPGSPGTVRVKALVTSRPLMLTGAVTTTQQQATTQSTPGQQEELALGQFRWHPTQRRQIHDLLRKRHPDNAVQPIEAADPKQILGPFAQDEVAFYVEPRAKATAGNRAPDNRSGVRKNSNGEAR